MTAELAQAAVYEADRFPDGRPRPLNQAEEGTALAIYDAVSPLQVEERIVGDTRWLAIRSRGAEWSYLTTDEAANLGRSWVARFGNEPEPVQNTPLPELSRSDLKLIRIDGGPPPSSIGWKVV